MARRLPVILLAILLAITVTSYSILIKMNIAPRQLSYIAVTPTGIVLEPTANITTPAYVYCNGTLELNSSSEITVTGPVLAIGNIRVVNGTLYINGTALNLTKLFTKSELVKTLGGYFLFKLDTAKIMVSRTGILKLNLTFTAYGPSSYPLFEISSSSGWVLVICVPRQD